jgi:hypothetical protein
LLKGREVSGACKEAPVAKASSGKKFVYFDSGAAYVTKSGIRLQEIEESMRLMRLKQIFLLTLDNFRIPDSIGVEDYYKENN